MRQRSAFNGTINFSADGSNPLNTNVGFANALLGAVTSYQKSDKQPVGHGQFVNAEFYAQDNWRVTANGFTIDAGVRFYVLTADPKRGRPGGAVRAGAVRPVGRAAALSARHDTARPPRAESADRRVLAGGCTSAGWSPDPASLTTACSCTRARRSANSPFEVAPRLGFAWNVTGDGRTAIRGGAGAFYDRYADNDILELAEMPPLVRTYTDELHDD